ncbi:hypothetical protein LSG25_14420 [Paralcaligenes sp. KSB-10]|uniref:hypothetical protein n=1 Tax=Paralcaligenes sp. KSB-10 TaxID=2901142 RepID=UPI001E536957|nr:hypothetical protein [Paralcaligenes sp. KSB-10]UHL63244.1 hypothetical protein LSG25_14420 [Paralcaligenes sp. KSB-10]
MTKKIISFSSYLFIFLFLCVLLSGLYLPVYSDEVVTKWGLARFFADNAHALSFFPQCSTSLDQPISPLFYPAAIIYSLVYGGLGPLGIRVSGILFALLWFFGIAYWVHKKTKETSMAIYIISALMALSAIGVMPYLLILSRSEQIVTTSLLFLCLSCLFWRDYFLKNYYSIFIILFLLIVSCLLYAHPKAIFFTPVIIFSAFHITQRKPKLLRFILFFLITAFAYQSFKNSSLLSHCQDAPGIGKIFAYNVIPLNLLFQSPIEFFVRGISNIYNAPAQIIHHITFQPSYQSGWLPGQGHLSSLERIINTSIIYIYNMLIFGSHIFILILFAYKLYLRQLTSALWLGILILFGSIGTAFFYNTWNFYGATQAVPISTILLLICLYSLKLDGKLHKIQPLFFLAVICASTSMGILASQYLPTMIINSQTLAADIKNQPLSIPVFNTKEHISTIRNLAKACGVSGDNAKNLVVDHMTYFAFTELRNPIHVLYISEPGFGVDLANGKLLPFLKKMASPAIIARCTYMPSQLKTLKTIELGGYCCINLMGQQ